LASSGIVREVKMPIEVKKGTAKRTCLIWDRSDRRFVRRPVLKVLHLGPLVAVAHESIDKSGKYIVSEPNSTALIAKGDTLDDAVRNARDIFASTVETYGIDAVLRVAEGGVRSLIEDFNEECYWEVLHEWIRDGARHNRPFPARPH
jgi:predicted RNase H-like HicB family nuclease